MLTKVVLRLRLVRIQSERIQIYKTLNTGSWIPKNQFLQGKERLKKLDVLERAIDEVLGIIE